jgi:hypothetical protein
MSLTKHERDALSGDDFAVPAKRKLPIHDGKHVRLAWDMVDRTHGLSDGERKNARKAILKKAGELGIDTATWSTDLQHTAESVLTIEAMSVSLDMPADDDHPNRMPFSGVLTKIDTPSDMPVGGTGSNGKGFKRTFLPRAVAKAILPSLIGMPIDFTPDFDGHDVKRKIGTITAASIEDDSDDINIEGFFYAADFPQECAFIKAEKEDLGFSYEIRAQTLGMGGDLLKIVGGKFTGAAVLYKNKAAYQSTSLAAHADQEIDMTNDEFKALFGELVKPITTQLTELGTKVGAIETGSAELKANAAMREKVAPHATALRNCAASMEAAGIGLDSARGHVRVLHHMAASMEAEAASGKLPHVYNDHSYLSHSAENRATAPALDAKAIEKAMLDAIKPLQDELGSAKTELADLKAKGFKETTPPARKTVSKDSLTLLAKGGITEAPKEPLNEAAVDKMLEAAGITSFSQRIAAKLQLTKDGLMVSRAA